MPSSQSRTATSDAPPSTLDKVRNNAAYLVYGGAAGAAAVPKSLATRSILTTSRYALRYIFWRLVRYAKYAVAGAVATALGGTLLASVTSGAAMLVAPSFFTATALGTGWAAAKFAWHHRPNSLRRIQANIESLLHISPSSPTPGEALTAATASAPKGWLSRLSDRAHSGADPKNDEQMDHTGDEAQSKVRDGKARARVAV